MLSLNFTLEKLGFTIFQSYLLSPCVKEPTDDLRTKEAMSPKEDSGECNLPSASQFEIKSLQVYRR